MSLRIIAGPLKGEYPEYIEMYLKWVPADGMLLQHMLDNFEMIRSFVYSLPEERLYFRYAEGKWTIKEILVHIIDDERIYAYRALCFARNDKTILPGFEQNDYAANSNANERSLENIFEEYEAVRKSTIAMFNGFSDDSLSRKGVANANEATVRAMAYHIAGHELHHFQLIKEKYVN